MPIARFGDFELDLKVEALRKEGDPTPIPLTHGETKFLVELAKRSGGLVTRDDFAQMRIVSLDERNITNTVSKLRKKLGEVCGKHVQTVAGEGYRLIAEFLQADSDSVASEIVKFFGSGVTAKSIRMVFGYRWLDGDISQMKCNLIESGQLKAKGVSENTPAPEGVNYWIPQSDIRSSIYVTNLLSKNVDVKGFKFLNDDYKGSEANCLAISFGLFSCYTLKLAELCGGKLFSVGYDYSPKISSFYTDNIVINDREVVPPDGKDIAIVARIVSYPEPDELACVQFVVAGRSASGTAAAGYFLAKSWPKISNLYGGGKLLERDSVAVVIHHDSIGKDDPSIDQTGQIHTFGDGEPMVVWAKHVYD